MPEPDKKVKTLWEMLQERVHGHGNGNGATLAFGNPLDLRVGSPLRMAFANGPEYADYDFTVQEIREYLRRIGGQEFSFTDYVLRGVNTKSFDADQAMTARVRVVPNQAGGRDALLLRLSDEFAFAEDFLAVVKDTTGTFEVNDDTDSRAGVPPGSAGVSPANEVPPNDATATFSRINDLRDSYEAAVMVISETTADGKAPPGKTSTVKLEYWDYWRDVEIGAGKTAKEFLFVEMNSDTGWFQIWRGREFFA